MKTLRVADLFCGAGGTSTGAVEAIESLGYGSHLTAINHWPVAIATHGENHPGARHYCTAVDNIDPRKLFAEGGLDLLWASPECTHHSNARGGRPKHDQSRATAFCVTRWAEALRPPVVLVENVPEFASWGPLDRRGHPIKARKGEIFEAWCAMLRAVGYRVESRVFCAADYGDPTTRERLFVQAVRGRRKITWPEPTHSRTGGGGLEPWVSAREIIDWSVKGESIFGRKRPLKPNTLRRIKAGLLKFGLGPFIVPGFGERAGQTPRTHGVDSPMPTVTAEGHLHLTQPFLVAMEHGGGVRDIARPMPTVTTAKGGAFGVCEPFLIHTAHTGERAPLDVGAPVPTVAGNRGDVALCEPALLPQQSGGALRPVCEPAPTIAAAGAVALVEPFLVEYYGNGGARSVGEPVATVSTHDRFGLVRPVIELHGTRYLLDIRFRMLQPGELAAAQGFRRDYRFTGTKTEQVKQIGNAVPRNLARALVLAALSQQTDIRRFVAGNKKAAA